MNKIQLVKKLMALRNNWSIRDYKEAYVGEWNRIPETVSECKEMMEEYIFMTYDESYIKECIECESL